MRIVSFDNSHEMPKSLSDIDKKNTLQCRPMKVLPKVLSATFTDK